MSGTCPECGHDLCMCKKLSSREIDALVAEKVFDHPDIAFYNGDYFGCEGDWPVPHYSTDIAAAWEVVEKMREQGGPTGVQWSTTTKDWFCLIGAGPKHIAVVHGATAPVAISLAALKAKGVEV